MRFTTGTLCVEPDRHRVTLPRLGRIKTCESTRKLARRIEAGTARILSATVSEDSAGRWHVAFQVLVHRAVEVPAYVGLGDPVVGVDVGVKADALLVVAAPDGRELERVPAPKSLTAAQGRLRALQRRDARQVGPYDPSTKTARQPSTRWVRQQRRIGRTHAHAAAVRRDVLHKATIALAQRHRVIVVETLNASGMRSAGGVRKKGLNLALADRTYACEHCGVTVDRDRNAAINFARLGETQCTGATGTGTGSSPAATVSGGDGRGATQKTRSAAAEKAAGCEVSTRHDNTVGQTWTASPEGEAA